MVSNFHLRETGMASREMHESNSPSLPQLHFLGDFIIDKHVVSLSPEMSIILHCLASFKKNGCIIVL